MRKILSERLRQGHRTLPFPPRDPALPKRFRGLPEVALDKCESSCSRCAEVCPTSSIVANEDGRLRSWDLGRCLFCVECQKACPAEAIGFSDRWRQAALHRQELVVHLDQAAAKPPRFLPEGSAGPAGLGRQGLAGGRTILGRSLKLRVVSAGGCNACEADVNVLNTVGFDLSRFGIAFVASPRHADGLLITGPVTPNMRLALQKTYQAVPEPKVVIAVGACAISGGLFGPGGADSLLPVDLYIPGCPPHPLTILDGLLKLLGRNRV